MLTVNIIAIGKLKESYLRDACNEYIKRLRTFCKLNIIELSESRLSDNPSEKEITSALADEAKAMNSFLIVKDSFNVAMCIEGKQFSSVEFSQQLEKAAINGKSTINLIIGSSFGIADEVKQMADLRLSMSKMTFPHQLARVMILEQIYRAFQISSNGKYHK